MTTRCAGRLTPCASVVVVLHTKAYMLVLLVLLSAAYVRACIPQHQDVLRKEQALNTKEHESSFQTKTNHLLQQTALGGQTDTSTSVCE